MSIVDDAELESAELTAIVRRDRDAFARWFARNEMALRGKLRSFARVVDVEAVVQETAILVWERASTVVPDGRRDVLRRWAVTVALNRARNDARRAGRQVPLEIDRGGDEAVAVVRRDPDPMLRERLRRCRLQLPAGLSRVLELRITDQGQRSDRELAISIGISFDAFRQSLARSRRALRACLRKFGIDVAECIG